MLIDSLNRIYGIFNYLTYSILSIIAVRWLYAEPSAAVLKISKQFRYTSRLFLLVLCKLSEVVHFLLQLVQIDSSLTVSQPQRCKIMKPGG